MSYTKELAYFLSKELCKYYPHGYLNEKELEMIIKKVLDKRREMV